MNTEEGKKGETEMQLKALRSTNRNVLRIGTRQLTGEGQHFYRERRWKAALGWFMRKWGGLEDRLQRTRE